MKPKYAEQNDMLRVRMRREDFIILKARAKEQGKTMSEFVRGVLGQVYQDKRGKL